MKIYLAGKMGGLTKEEMNGWRFLAQDYLNICSPFKSNDVCINPVSFYNSDNYIELKATGREIMDFDLTAIKNCDLLLVNLNHTDSMGTAIEMFYAHDILKMPVISFAYTDNFEKSYVWVKECSTKNFSGEENNLEEALEYINKFYRPIFG